MKNISILAMFALLAGTGILATAGLTAIAQEEDAMMDAGNETMAAENGSMAGNETEADMMNATEADMMDTGMMNETTGEISGRSR